MCSNIPDCESCAQREADEQAIERLQDMADGWLGPGFKVCPTHGEQQLVDDLRRVLRLARSE